MSLRDDLIPVVDETRAIVAELGFRVRAPVDVVTVTVTEASGALHPVTTTSSLTLSPAPRVREVPIYDGAEAGKVEVGDIIVDRISATYTRTQLDPAGDSHWLVGGQPYRLVSCEERPVEWRVRLRRLNRNA